MHPHAAGYCEGRRTFPNSARAVAHRARCRRWWHMCGAVLLAAAHAPRGVVGTYLAHRFIGQRPALAVFYTCLGGISLVSIVAPDAHREQFTSVAQAISCGTR